MEKINNFTITRLFVRGFKCFEDKTSFSFGPMTYITAANGLGKSSIADAIAFAFTGTPFFEDGKGLDRLQNKAAREMEVCVEFVDDKDAAHTLMRNRKKDTSGIIFDGYTVRQSDLNNIFGDKEVFLAVFNPLYFIDVLGENGGKGLLEKLLPVIEHKDILAALPESARKILASESLVSPETFIRAQRAEIRRLEEMVIGYKGQQDLANRQRGERNANLAGLRAELDKVNFEISELEAFRNKDRDPIAEKQSLTKSHHQREKLISETANNAQAERAQQDDISKITKQIRELELYITEQAAKPYICQFAAQISEADANLKSLYAEHKKLTDALNNTTVGYTCHICMTEITEQNIAAVKEGLQQKISVVVSDGKIARAALDDLKKQDAAALQEFEASKSKLLEAEHGKLSDLNHRLQELSISHDLDAQNYTDKLSSLNDKIKELEHRVKFGNLSPEQVRRLGELEYSKLEYTAKLAALNNISEDSDFKTMITNTEDAISRLNIVINEAELYRAKRTEMMFAGLKMNRAEIVLYELIKSTGELKDCFRFSYEGRDYRCLSLSEKIKAGLEVSQLIQRLTGRNYPVFVDNAESLCAVDNVTPAGQMILSRVVRNESLKIACKDKDNNNVRKAG